MLLLYIPMNMVIAIIATVILAGVGVYYTIRFFKNRKGKEEFQKLTNDLGALVSR
jgi:putative Mn2+ efflux pump MntP